MVATGFLLPLSLQEPQTQPGICKAYSFTMPFEFLPCPWILSLATLVSWAKTARGNNRVIVVAKDRRLPNSVKDDRLLGICRYVRTNRVNRQQVFTVISVSITLRKRSRLFAIRLHRLQSSRSSGASNFLVISLCQIISSDRIQLGRRRSGILASQRPFTSCPPMPRRWVHIFSQFLGFLNICVPIQCLTLCK